MWRFLEDLFIALKQKYEQVFSCIEKQCRGIQFYFGLTINACTNHILDRTKMVDNTVFDC